MSGLTVAILGSAAGGGVPQWNCRCPVCSLFWTGDPRVEARTQSSIAISADDEHWLLINASPDLRQQIISTPTLQPKTGARHSPIAAVALTNADIDHIAGLLVLRERHPFTVYATGQTQAILKNNSVFNVLADDVVLRASMVMDEMHDTGFGLKVRPFAVPGKVALFMEQADNVRIGDVTETTIGLEVTTTDKRLVYIPGCAAITDDVRLKAANADLLLYDGTTYTDDEMPKLGLSAKTARRMGHTPITGPNGSLNAFDALSIRQKAYIHINNTNPILIDGSDERLAVEASGWVVTRDGMMFSL
jgi:pyrroloquinoline quinone biosynthesis protein B